MAKIKVNVVVSYPQEKYFSVEAPFSEYPENTTCLYVPLPRDANLATIDNVLNHLPVASRSSSFIVFRFHKPDLVRLESEKNTTQLKLVSKRFNRAALYFLSWEETGGTYLLKHLEFSPKPHFPFSEERLIKEIRHSELYSIIHQPNILLDENDDFHYIFSNGNHYKKFLRVGNALYSKDVLDSFCFWLLPFVKSKPLIFLDSNSIISLGLNLIHYCHDCNIITDLKWFGNVECLTDYFESDTDILIKLTKKLRGENPATNILNIFSAKGTGRLCAKIKGICNESELAIVKNVILFSSEEENTSHDEEVFCYLDDGFKGYSSETSCTYCNQKSVGIKIDDKTYTLDLPAATKLVSLSLPSIKATANFFSKYSNTHCFTIHRDQHDGLRHHMIHLDVCQLLKNEKFIKQVSDTVIQFKNVVDVILFPEHKAAEELAVIVNKVLKVPIVKCDHNKLKNLSHENTEVLRKSKNILIVDDVVISGTRLNEYKELLDRIGIKTSETVIKLFVGVARPSNEDDLSGIKDYLFPHNNFACAEKLLLPNWGNDLCPWCWEERKLSNSDGKLVNDPLILERHNNLRSKNKGLKENLFLQWDKESLLKHGKRETVFGPMKDEIEIFVAIASVIQTMRSSKILNEVGSQSKPVAKVYDIGKYLKGRYYEDFIRACIFRASVRTDIRSSKIEHDLKEKVAAMIHKEDHSSVFVPELIFNIAQEKLPMVQIDDKIMETGNSGIVSFLKLLYSTEKGK